MNNQIKRIINQRYEEITTKTQAWYFVQQAHTNYTQTATEESKLHLYYYYKRYKELGGSKVDELAESFIQEVEELREELRNIYLQNECSSSVVNLDENVNVLIYTMLDTEFTEGAYFLGLECSHCEKWYFLVSPTNSVNNDDYEMLGLEEDEDGLLVCRDCTDYYVRCSECGRLVNGDCVQHATDKYDDDVPFCSNCYDNLTFYCEHCECQRVSADFEVYSTADGSIICSNCRDNYYMYCSECDELYHQDDLTYSDELDDYICSDCEHEREEKNRINVEVYNTTISRTIPDTYEETSNSELSSYHHYPRKFTKYLTAEEQLSNEKMFIGAELEISDRSYRLTTRQFNGVCKYIKDNYNAVVSSDGSINGQGLEMISDPQTIGVWLARRNTIENLFKNLRNWDFKSDNGDTGCGLHFHVSREALGNNQEEIEETIARIDLILENFKSELINFSRRDESTLRRWATFLSDISPRDLKFSLDLIKKEKSVCSPSGGRRYQALNLENEHTIEFRFFKGSLNAETFFASLELVYNIVNLAKNGDFTGKNWNYLVKMGKFADLQNYAKRRGLKSNTPLKDRTKKERLLAIKQDQIELKKFTRQALKVNEMIDYIKENQKEIELIIEKGHNYENVNSRLYYSINYLYNRYHSTNELYIKNAYKNANDIMYTFNSLLENGQAKTTKRGTRYYIYSDEVMKRIRETFNSLKEEMNSLKERGLI